jgi:hypothetical protein
MRWAIVMMVRLSNMLLRRVAWSMASVSTSTAAVASSRTKMLLGVSSARANDTNCRWPWLRFDPGGEKRPPVSFFDHMQGAAMGVSYLPPSWTTASNWPSMLDTCSWRRACPSTVHSSVSSWTWRGSRLSRIVPSKRAASCGIIASLRRRSRRPMVDVLRPSILHPKSVLSQIQVQQKDGLFEYYIPYVAAYWFDDPRKMSVGYIQLNHMVYEPKKGQS